MAAGKRDPELGPLAGLMPDDVAAAYYKLLTCPRVLKEEAAGFLGDARLVEELAKRGLARVVAAMPDTPPTFQAAPPAVALETALIQFQAKVLKDQELLLAGHRRLSDLPLADAAVTASCEHLVQVVVGREQVARTTGYLINSARKDWMTLETAASDLPLTEDNDVKSPYGDTVRVRSIYETAHLRNPGARGVLERSVARGEQAKILPVVRLKLQIADRSAALFPLSSTGTGGAVLFREGPAVDGARDYFEMLWKMALPYGAPKPLEGCPLSKLQVEILRLMRAGEPDKTIAGSLGFSVSKVRREIDDIEAKAGGGAKGRFALGVELERRGWLPREMGDHD